MLLTRNPVWVGIQLFLVVAWIVLGVLHRKGETHLMDKGQRYSLTSLYHDAVVYAVAGPTATVTTIIAFFVGEWNFANIVLRLVVIWCVVAYARSIIFDVRNPNRTTFDGMTLLDVAHVNHSYPWQWMRRPGHAQWWFARFRSQVVNEIPALRRFKRL
ncbi:MAG TPA: hypothetical protein VM581_02425 [Magnetospirillaceae bacterium]|nr:hypothetical protein [Magnetospirillaceae bacterium]